MKRIRIGLLLLPILLIVGFSKASSAGAAPKEQFINNDQLDLFNAEELTRFVDGYVAENMADAHAPGLVITVIYQEEIVLAKGYGVADIETGRLMTPQTNIRAGSVSKPVTSVGVLQLVSEGKIALDAPVSDYLTNLPLADEYGPAGTVAQLLSLKGGYADAVLLTHSTTVEEWQPLGDYLQSNLSPRTLPPGVVYSYNSWDHALLGQVMVEVSDQSFDQVMVDTVFRPLGMANTTFTQPLPEFIAANLATGYEYVDGSYKEVPVDYVNLSPGIGLVTTGEDMGRFMLALLNEGVLESEHVLSPATVAGMLNRQEAVHSYSRGRTYGLSEITLGGHQVLYQDGNGIGHGNRIILAPDYGLGIFLSTNHRPLAHDASGTLAYNFIKDLSTALLEHFLPASNQEASRLMPLADAAERAHLFTGHYRLAGTPQQDFFKLGALLDNVNVRDNGDGTILIGSNRYAEVEPLLFQSESDPSFFVVFIENDKGEIAWLTFGGTGSYQKVRWFETPAVQITLLGIILVGLLSFAIVMPFSRYRYWPVWLISVIGIAFLTGLAYMMIQADLILFFKTIPLATKLLFVLPWLFGTLTLLYPFALVSLWRKQPGVGGWLLYALNIAAVGAFIWFASYWNLYII